MQTKQFALVLFLIVFVPSFLRAQSELERFERQLEQIRRETTLMADERIPLEQRALIDYGGFIAFNYLSLDDPRLDNHVLRQYDLVGYARVNFDGAREFFLRARTGWRDFNDGDSFDGRGDERIDPDFERLYYRFDLARYNAAYRGREIDNNIVIKAGRDLAYWANGLTLSQVVDGVIADISYSELDVQVVAGVTPVRTVDIDSSRPSFDHHTRRGFYGGILSKRLGQHRPFVYGLVQRDYNDDDTSVISGIVTEHEYDSHYIGAGSVGGLTDRIIYGVEVVYQGGSSLSNSFEQAGATLVQIAQTDEPIHAWALDARLDYLLPDERQTRFTIETILASGDEDRGHTSNTFNGNLTGTDDEAFNAFGLLNTGMAFAPTASNLLVVRGGVLMFPLPNNRPFERLQLGVDVFLFHKLDGDAPIDEPTFEDEFLGWEPDIFINWPVTSDVTIALRYGIFFPGSAIINDDEPRHFIGAGVTYAF